MRIITVEHKGIPTQVNIAEQTSDMLEDLGTAGRGRFAYITGHVSGTVGKKKCTRSCVSNRWFLSRIRYTRYVERMIAAIEAVEFLTVISRLHPEQFDKVRAYCEKKKIAPETLFNESQETLLSRLHKEDTGTAGQREGQAVNVCQINGWTITLQTAKDPDTGLMRPVLDDSGRMTAKSIKLPFFEISKVETPTAKYPGLHPGKYEKTNSRPDTIMRNAVERTAQEMGGIRQYKTFSLQAGKYQKITMDGKAIYGMVRDSETAEMDAKLAEFIQYVGELEAAPLAALLAEAAVVAPVTA